MDVSEILSELDDHGFSDTATARKMEAINEALWDVCGREPWPFLETSIDLNFDGSSGLATNWPTNFSKALILIWRSNGRRISWVRTDDFYEQFGASLTTTGDPYCYYFESNQGYVYPIPSSGSALVRMKYIRSHAELTSSDVEGAILLPARYHRGVLVNGAASALYAMEDDPELSSFFERRFEKAISNMKADLWSRQFDRNDVIHVVDPDDWNELDL